jgi:hypothetical protein
MFGVPLEVRNEDKARNDAGKPVAHEGWLNY